MAWFSKIKASHHSAILAGPGEWIEGLQGFLQVLRQLGGRSLTGHLRFVDGFGAAEGAWVFQKT